MGKASSVLALAALLAACAPPAEEPCAAKWSAGLMTAVGGAGDDARFEVVVTVSDTAALAAEFPELSFPNPSVALGHLTRSRIHVLCRHTAVLSIDRPKLLKPLPVQR
ncbi:MAG: hypothetical protein F9K22_01865 [Bacteroidetes bacterium]|nr:MAG: hypothetical protein F9K22_01865 [Bacteroidota bacterium]